MARTKDNYWKVRTSRGAIRPEYLRKLTPEEDKETTRSIIKMVAIAFAILIGCTLYGEHLDYVKDQQQLQQSTIQQAR
jgi:hypothetical protein